jgi:hypothetical protein
LCCIHTALPCAKTTPWNNLSNSPPTPLFHLWHRSSLPILVLHAQLGTCV